MTAPRRSPVARVAAGVHCLRSGRWRLASNVYLVGSGSAWVLVDAGWPASADAIVSAAEDLFGAGTRPAAIVLTHVHPDHAGAAADLARRWDLPVHVHPAEVAQAAGGIVPGRENPLDRVVVRPVLRLLPRRLRPGHDPLADVVRPLDPDGPPPGLPDWRCVVVPGHTPGSIAFFRPADRVLLTGDAVLTIDPNSARGLLRSRPVLGGPPWVSTWDWARARASVAVLARLEPAVIAAGHGAVVTARTSELRALPGRMHRPLRATEGFFRGVDYTAPTPYRRPPEPYLRMQWLARLLTRLGWSPGDVVTLEVPGRRTAAVRRTTLLRTRYGGRCYLVALAGESDWVRNVRAAGGAVVLGRRRRRAATLVELSPEERPPILRAYSDRPGRRAAATAREARTYFGLGADPSRSQLRAVADRYPVFRIDQPTTAGGSRSSWARSPVSAGPG